MGVRKAPKGRSRRRLGYNEGPAEIAKQYWNTCHGARGNLFHRCTTDVKIIYSKRIYMPRNKFKKCKKFCDCWRCRRMSEWKRKKQNIRIKNEIFISIK